MVKGPFKPVLAVVKVFLARVTHVFHLVGPVKSKFWFDVQYFYIWVKFENVAPQLVVLLNGILRVAAVIEPDRSFRNR